MRPIPAHRPVLRSRLRPSRPAAALARSVRAVGHGRGGVSGAGARRTSIIPARSGAAGIGRGSPARRATRDQRSTEKGDEWIRDAGKRLHVSSWSGGILHVTGPRARKPATSPRRQHVRHDRSCRKRGAPECESRLVSLHAASTKLQCPDSKVSIPRPGKRAEGPLIACKAVLRAGWAGPARLVPETPRS